jgi:hypothetical protein
MMITLVGNTESRNTTTSRVPSYVPQMIETISGSSHRATTHVSKERGTRSKSRLRVTKLPIERRAGQMHVIKLKVESMKSASARIHSIHTSIKERHIRTRESSRGKTRSGQLHITGDGTRVGVRISNEIKVTLRIGRTQESRIDTTGTSKIGVPRGNISESRKIKKVNLELKTWRGTPSI